MANSNAQAQSIGIGTQTPNANALLDLNSETKGLLIPRIPLLALNNAAPFAIPPTSLLVFNTTFTSELSQGFYFWRGNKWNRLTSSDDVWSTTGNAGTNAAPSFIGTTDNVSLWFRVRNVNSGLIDSGNSRTTFGYGTARSAGGPNNSAFGYKALGSSSSQAVGNTAIGFLAIEILRRGFSNVGVGGFTIRNLDSGTNNTGIGSSALSSLEIGDANTAVGFNTMAGVSNGDSNTAVGFKATMLTGTKGSTAIGALSIVNADNSIVLGSIAGFNTATTSAKVGIGTPQPAFSLHVANNDAANGGHLQGIMVENLANTTGEAAINFRNQGTAGTGINYWMVGLNQNRNMTFAYGNDFNGSTTRLVVDSLGNLGVGVINPTQRLDVNGSVKMNGELYNGTSTANLLPIVYGNVSSSATIQSGTGNFSIVKAGTGLYDITLTGNPYTVSAYAVSVTIASSAGRFATTSANGAALRISVFDAAGTLVDAGFHFMVMKP